MDVESRELWDRIPVSHQAELVTEYLGRNAGENASAFVVMSEKQKETVKKFCTDYLTALSFRDLKLERLLDDAQLEQEYEDMEILEGNILY